MTFGNLFDKLKSSTKQAAETMKFTGKIAGLKMERTTQKAERERLLKEIGSKTFSIFSKTQSLNLETLEEEVINELRHIERIDKRIEEIEVEIDALKKEMVESGKDVVDAEEVTDEDDDEKDEEDDDSHDDKSNKSRKK